VRESVRWVGGASLWEGRRRSEGSKMDFVREV